MRPAAVVFLLAGLALLGWVERRDGPVAAVHGGASLPVGSAAAREDALARRGVELALASGRAPTEDRLLDGGASLATGNAPPLPALLAAVARRTVLRGADATELGTLEPRRLLRLFERLAPALGVLAVVAVFLVTRLLHGGPARDVAGLLAAGLYALAPGVVLAERAGRVAPAALATLLGCALLACARVAWGARSELDRTTGALLGGPLLGLALVVAPSLTPLGLVFLAGAALASSAQDWRGSARALALAAAGALLVLNLALGAPAQLPGVWPAARLALPTSATELGLSGQAWVLLPVALVALALPPRDAARLPLVGWGALALAWALTFGPAAPGVGLAACVLFALAAARGFERASQGRRPLVLAAAVLLASLLGMGRASPAYAPDADEVARRADWAQALELLRTATPSSGPWNHAGARPEGFVLCAPEVGVEVAVGARRAVLACELPRLVTPPERLERARAARALLDAPPTAATADVLARRSVRHVLVGPGDRARAPGGLAAVLAEAGPDEGPPGFERVWAAPSSGCALWAVR